jgi:hydroxyacylglutathione hydrolase
MPHEITPIALRLPLRMGSVSGYLIATDDGYVLVDTGPSSARADLESALLDAGCKPGNLRLIVLTHGDFDHIGNAAYLRDRFSAKIAMHAEDAGMAERGDMFFNRKSGNAVFRRLVPVLYRFSKSDRFTPDVTLDEADDLSEYGLDATVIRLPGHSTGSIGILMAGGDLIGGDLFENTKQPALNGIMDDREAAAASVGRLKGLAIRTVYPGHGKPFAFDPKSFENP